MLPYKSPVPRTKLTRTLLTDNVNDERKLQVYLERLLRDRRKQSAKMRQQLTAFENHQDSKKRLWSRTDELQLSRLNLPQIQLGKTTLKSVTLEESTACMIGHHLLYTVLLVTASCPYFLSLLPVTTSCHYFLSLLLVTTSCHHFLSLLPVTTSSHYFL
ncbi:hypothetical protein EB796_011370 [Bugula neritina]|uniref:Uncharacterized protein n=1 Tax=Bugula neritina TaxID=10212 RepID=A0A7J7JV94_BUGNE|nr:hypothetical protein EB796_011370 [Bugula neritina]